MFFSALKAAAVRRSNKSPPAFSVAQRRWQWQCLFLVPTSISGWQNNEVCGWPPKISGFIDAYHTYCSPWFESQAHRLLCVFQFNLLKLKLYLLLEWKRTRINEKEAGIDPYFLKNIDVFRYLILFLFIFIFGFCKWLIVASKMVF